MNTPANFAKVQASINKRRHTLGEAVWNHIGQEARNMIQAGECAAAGVNLFLFIKWSAKA